jgi:hypothetical protein
MQFQQAANLVTGDDLIRAGAFLDGIGKIAARAGIPTILSFKLSIHCVLESSVDRVTVERAPDHLLQPIT